MSTEDYKFKQAVKERLAELAGIFTSSEVDCMVLVFRIGNNNYNCMFGDVVEITKLLLDTRNVSEDFNAIMKVQDEVQNTIDKSVNMMAPNSDLKKSYLN